MMMNERVSEATCAAAQRQIVGGSIAWADGEIFDVADPYTSASSVTLRQYAVALAFTTRWRGQTFVDGREAMWSVMDHLIEGAEQLIEDGADRRVVREWLGHESDEVIFGDTAGPLKQYWSPAYRERVQMCGDALDLRFGFTCVHKDEIKRMDVRMLVTEKRDLLRGHDDAQLSTDGEHMADDRYAPLKRRLRPGDPHDRVARFIEIYNWTAR